MKKVFTFVLLVGLFAFLPFKVSAMIEVDENGNPVEREAVDGEYRIMNDSVLIAPAPDASVSSDNTTNINPTTDDYANPDAGDLADDNVLYTASQEDAKVLDKAANDHNEVLDVIIYGAAGIIIGSVATYLLKK